MLVLLVGERPPPSKPEVLGSLEEWGSQREQKPERPGLLVLLARVIELIVERMAFDAL